MKYKTILRFFIANLVIISFSRCFHDIQRDIYFKNMSGKSIYYGLSYSYPDTSLAKIEDHPGNNKSIAYKVKSGEKTTLPADNFVYNPTMQLVIFDADSIENIPWDSIVKHNTILKRYKFTEKDMKECGWTISYE